MRYQVDGSWRRFGRVLLAGSPLRLFRLTPGGVAVIERLEAGDDDVGTGANAVTLIDRLLDAGAIHPRRPATGHPRFGVDDVTIVTPQLDGVVHDDGRITVDDGSVPPLAGASVRLSANAGPAAARNAARALIDTALVAFVDADVSLPDPHWLSGLLWHFDDPRVGLVAPRVEEEDRSPLDVGDQPARIRAGTRVSYVPAAALVVRIEALDEIGWFDETLRFGEDVDLVWRLDEVGWRCRFDPSVTVWHRPRGTWRARLRQHAGYGTSAAPLALRHPGALSPIHVNGWTAATWLLAFAGCPGGATTLAVGSSSALVRKLRDVPPVFAWTLAMRGHILAATQFAAAARRVWWPIIALGALVSRRFRVAGLLAIAADVRSTPTDLAYGWGVWTSMRRLRTVAPIVPRLTAWPERSPKPPNLPNPPFA